MAIVQGTLTFQESKCCTRCGEELPLTSEFFSAHKLTRCGFSSHCRSCERAKNRASYYRHHEKHRAKKVEYARKQIAKKTPKLDKGQAGRESRWRGNDSVVAEKKRKAIEELERINAEREAKKDKRHPNVIASENAKRRRRANPDYQHALDKAKRERGGEKRRAYERELNRKPHIRKRANAWARKRRKENPTWRISECMSAAISQSLRGTKNRRKWQTLVGYTVDDLRRHLESKFTEGMTWENHGKFGWHIDHIRPIASFDFKTTEDVSFLECWSLSNLQPLWWRDNLAKSDKIV